MFFPTYFFVYSLVASLACSAATEVQFPEKYATLIQQILGDVIDEKQKYYSVSEKYAARFFFNPGGKLVHIEVVPKEYVNEVRWKFNLEDDSLTLEVFNTVLQKLSSIEQIGKRVATYTIIGWVSNARHESVTYYDSAVVIRGVNSFIGQFDEGTVRDIDVMYFLPVKGVVKEKSETSNTDSNAGYRLNIDGKWYYVREKDYNRASLESSMTLDAAVDPSQRYDGSIDWEALEKIMKPEATDGPFDQNKAEEPDDAE